MALNIKTFGRKLGMSVSAGLLLATAPLAAVHATSPTAINSCQELQKIGNDISYPLSGSYVLANDIDCTAATASGGALYNSGKGFAPIGDSSHPFTGTLNGQGYTITGFKINRPTEDHVGLFSYSQDATIENLQFVSASVKADSYAGVVSAEEKSITLNNVTAIGTVSTPAANSDGYVGGLIGYNHDNSTGPSQLTNDYFGGSVSANGDSTAGLIGDNDGDAVITESGSSADVTCNFPSNFCDYFGGLVGDSDGDLTISKSFATGNVNGDANVGDSIGGLVGWSDHDTISNSFATGNVTGHVEVGTLIGVIDDGTVDTSYGSGKVTAGSGSSDVGGFIGYTNAGSATITKSFFDSTKSNFQACGDNPSCTGITGLTNTQMKVNSHFTGAGWDFTNIWRQNSTENSGLPFLRWASDDSELDPVTGKSAELVVPAGCFVNNMNMEAESSEATADAAFRYPDGLMNFSVTCGDIGFKALITQYIVGATHQDYVVRKYNPVTHQYADVPNASITYVKFGSETAAKIVYSITDGGKYDSDGVANGTVVDPVGLALETGAPNTGAGMPTRNIILPIGLLILGGAGIIATRRFARR